jgi:hypothetical protein
MVLFTNVVELVKRGRECVSIRIEALAQFAQHEMPVDRIALSDKKVP